MERDDDGRCCLVHRTPDGRICAPARAVAEDGTLGDGVVYLGPTDPAWPVWDAYLRRREGLNTPGRPGA